MVYSYFFGLLIVSIYLAFAIYKDDEDFAIVAVVAVAAVLAIASLPFYIHSRDIHTYVYLSTYKNTSFPQP